MKKISTFLLLLLTTICTSSLIMAEARAQLPGSLTNGLIGYYQLNGTGSDSSGAGNNGTAVNVTYSTNRFGLANSSASFATADQNNRPYVAIPNFTTLDNFPITMSLWFKLNAYPTQFAPIGSGNIMTLIGKEGSGLAGEGALALFNKPGEATNQISYMAYYEYNDNFVTSFTPEVDRWYHLAFTFDEVNIARFFLNGALFEQRSFTNTTMVSESFRIGSSTTMFFDLNAYRQSWNGLIDDAAVYDRALSSAEIGELYAYQSVPEPSTYALLLLSGAASLWALKRRKS
jgi:hypothetical protein